MILSSWWKWWAVLLVVLGCSSIVSANTEWIKLQPIVEDHLSQNAGLESLQSVPQNVPRADSHTFVLSEPKFISNDYSGDPDIAADGANSAEDNFPSGYNLAFETVNPAMDPAQIVVVESQNRSPRFISKFKEWFKEKDKDKKKEEEDKFQVVISHHAAQAHHSDHHSGSHGYGHGQGQGHDYHGGGYGHDYHGGGYGHGYHGGGYGHGYHGQGGHHGGYSNIHIHGFSPYHQHPYSNPAPHYPYHHYPPPSHHHHHHQPHVAQPIIIGKGGGKGKGHKGHKGHDNEKIIIIGSGSGHGNYGNSGYRYIQG